LASTSLSSIEKGFTVSHEVSKVLRNTLHLFIDYHSSLEFNTNNPRYTYYSNVSMTSSFFSIKIKFNYISKHSSVLL